MKSMKYFIETVKPCYSAVADKKKVLPKEHENFGPMNYFYGYFYVDNNKKLGIKHNFDSNCEINCVSGVS